MKTTITFEIDTSRLTGYTDTYLAQLWYISQANPAPIQDAAAAALTEHIGREIISRWIRSCSVPLWEHQGSHAANCELAPRREKYRQ